METAKVKKLQMKNKFHLYAYFGFILLIFLQNQDQNLLTLCAFWCAFYPRELHFTRFDGMLKCEKSEGERKKEKVKDLISTLTNYIIEKKKERVHMGPQYNVISF